MAAGDDEMRFVNIGELKINTKMRKIFVENTDIESADAGIMPGNPHDIFGKIIVSSDEEEYMNIGTFMLNQKPKGAATDKQEYVKIGDLKIEGKLTEIYFNGNESAEILPGKMYDVFDKEETSDEKWVKIGKLMLEQVATDMYDCKKMYNVRIDDPVALQARYDNHLRSEEIYQIRSKPKGRVLLINNEFRGDKLQRDGSEIDVTNMENLWKQLDCEVTTKQNLSSYNIREAIQEFITETKDVDYCALFVMSHGETYDMVVGNGKTPVYVKELVDYFRSNRCPHLDGKPKLLFFQICRGNKSLNPDQVDGVSEKTWLINLLREALPEGKILGESEDQTDATGFDDKSRQNPSLLEENKLGAAEDQTDAPNRPYTYDQSHIMVAFATSAGYVSFRNTRIGSWFIDAIANEFSKMVAQNPIEEIMKEVKENVYRRRADTPYTKYHGHTALCDISFALAKRLYFYPGCHFE